MTKAERTQIRAYAPRRFNGIKAKIDIAGGVHVLRWSAEERRNRWIFAGWDHDILWDLKDQERFLADT